MQSPLIPALIAGIFASGLFVAVFGAGLGFIFMFLPAFPLFFIGLSARSSLVYVSVFAATLLIAGIAGSASGILFLLFLGLPAWYFSQKSLLSGSGIGGGERAWYPIGYIIINLALYACVLTALITWYYSHEPGGLPQLLGQSIRDALFELEGDYGEIIERMAGVWVFLLLPMTIWLWEILLYALACLANKALIKQKKQVRPNMAVEGFLIPGWMLTLLAIAALATLIGGPSMSFLGKMTLLILMLPYFFLGCALMHVADRIWSKSLLTGRFFIFFVYFLVFTQLWPALILAGIGLWHQIKYLSGNASWFKS